MVCIRRWYVYHLLDQIDKEQTLDNLRNEWHVSPPPLDLRPSLAEIWTATRFDTKQCAERAEVGEEIILMMFRRVPVDHLDAAKVLKALSEMSGKSYSLDTVKVELIRVL